MIYKWTNIEASLRPFRNLSGEVACTRLWRVRASDPPTAKRGRQPTCSCWQLQSQKYARTKKFVDKLNLSSSRYVFRQSVGCLWSKQPSTGSTAVRGVEEVERVWYNYLPQLAQRFRIASFLRKYARSLQVPRALAMPIQIPTFVSDNRGSRKQWKETEKKNDTRTLETRPGPVSRLWWVKTGIETHTLQQVCTAARRMWALKPVCRLQTVSTMAYCWRIHEQDDTPWFRIVAGPVNMITVT